LGALPAQRESLDVQLERSEAEGVAHARRIIAPAPAIFRETSDWLYRAETESAPTSPLRQ
jgi:hypothetical protein